MAHYYYVWKDPKCNGVNPDWISMSGRRFFEFTKEHGAGRYFITIDEGADQGMDIITIEATQERYLEWHKQHQAAYRYKKQQEKYTPLFVSIDAAAGDQEDMTFHDIIPDEDVDVEEEVMRKIIIADLYKALSGLSEEEQDFINLLYFSNDEDLSEREIARRNNIDQGTLRYRKKKIFMKLKKFLLKS